MDFCHSQAPFLELIILKNVRAHFFPRYFSIKSHGSVPAPCTPGNALPWIMCPSLPQTAVYPNSRTCTSCTERGWFTKKGIMAEKITGCCSTYMRCVLDHLRESHPNFQQGPQVENHSFRENELSCHWENSLPELFFLGHFLSNSVTPGRPALSPKRQSKTHFISGHWVV